MQRCLFNHIEVRIAGELRLAELIAIAGLSEDPCLRAVKVAVSQMPHQFVLRRRIVRARELRERTAMPVEAVALATGFRGPSHIVSVFRQQPGATPCLWRSQRYGM